jgi:hypothetical protein
MPNPWDDAIRNRKPLTLTVFATPAVTGGIWNLVFKKALQEFNRLSSQQKLKVTLVETTTKPSEDDSSGADVQFDAVSGPQTIKAFRQTMTTISRGGVDVPIEVPGDSTDGLTIPIGRATTPAGFLIVEKAFVFVPITPMARTSPDRLVGDPVKLVIAVHELLHVCGLRNEDHSPQNNSDVFIGTPVVTPQLDTIDPKNPDRDRVSNGGVFGRDKRSFPPITISARTAGLIQKNWP